MLKIKITIIFTLIFAHLTIFGQQKGTLKIIVTNVKVAEGSVHVALFNEEGKFLEDEFLDKSAKVSNTGEVEIVINDLPSGRYGISTFHDINDNGELDTNFIGIPKEPFGFGNDAMGAFGPPGFEKASVMVSDGETTTHIKLKSF